MSLLLLDFETFYDDDFSLSRKHMTNQKYIQDSRFAVHGVGLKRLNGEGVWVTGKKCQAILEKVVPSSTVVVHNHQFDVAILEWHYGLTPKRVIDTLALSRALLGGAIPSHSLKNVAKLLLGKEKGEGLLISKGKWKLDAEEEKILADYCVHREDSDINLTEGIFKRLIRFFPQEELDVLQWTVEAFSQPTVMLNAEMLEKYYEEIVQRKKEALERAGLESREILMSNDKYALALEELGVVPPRKISRTTGKENWAFAKTDEAHKELLEHEDDRVQALVAARMEVKSTIEETRSLAYLEASRYGPWPVDYRFSGTESHRFSGGSGAGGNPQNLHRAGTLRRAIHAPKDHTFVTADLRQIQLRFTLGLAGEEATLQRLAAGENLYCWFGSQLLQKEITKADEAEYHLSKETVLGSGFGMGGSHHYTYCRGKGIRSITPELSDKAIDLYRTLLPGVPKLWRMLDKTLLLMERGQEFTFPQRKPLFSTGKEPLLGSPGIKLPGGLWLKYHNLRIMTEDNVDLKTWERYGGSNYAQWVFDSNRKTYTIWGGTILAHLAQALERKTITEMLVRCSKFFKENSLGRLVMISHDEIIAVVPDSKVEIAKAIMKKIMTTSPTWWPELPLDSELGTGKNYAEAKG